MKKAFISVGEISGDMYAAQLVKHIPDFKWKGIVGPKLKELGIKPIANIKDISVVGLTEALPKYKHIRSVFKKSIEEIKDVDVVIAIDFPGFNLKLLKEAKKLGKKTIYFIPPQVWAWGKGRIKKIVEYSDLIITILPFEKELYKPYQRFEGQVQYVGHPLLDIIQTNLSSEELKEALNINKNHKLIGLFAGSRESEVKTLLPVLLQTAKLLERVYPEFVFVIPTTENVKQLVLSFTDSFKDIPLRVVSPANIQNISYEVMEKAAFSFIASGTATLEAAIIGQPFALVYKVSPLTFFIGKKLVSINYLGLPNIIANRQVVKEFLQDECNPINLANYSLSTLENPTKYNQIKKDLQMVRRELGDKGAIKKAATLIKAVC